MLTRQEKYNSFQEFKNKSKELFEQISKQYKKDDEIKKIYSFHTAPGGRMGGLNDRQIDVFYGYRIINVQKCMGANFQIETKTETENGCQITFQHLNDGRTMIYLFPCNSETFKPAEEFIILKLENNPKNLLKINNLKRLYKYMKSYMAVTCSENIASLMDRIVVFYLKTFKEVCINEQVQITKFSKVLKKLATIIFTVGFSGFCLAFIPFFSNSKQLNELTNEIKEINRELQKIEIIQNELITKTDFSNQILKVSDEELLSKLNSELAEINKEIKDINAKVEKKK